MIGNFGYINNQQFPFIGPIKIYEKCEKLPPLDNGGPEIKFTYFQYKSWKK